MDRPSEPKGKWPLWTGSRCREVDVEEKWPFVEV